mgnify:CR=1 FL=1
MRHRFTKVLLGLVLFTTLSATATVTAKSVNSDKSADSSNVRVTYSRTGLLPAFGGAFMPGHTREPMPATTATTTSHARDDNPPPAGPNPAVPLGADGDPSHAQWVMPACFTPG